MGTGYRAAVCFDSTLVPELKAEPEVQQGDLRVLLRELRAHYVVGVSGSEREEDGTS